MATKIHTIDGYNIIEYEKTNIYIVENILDDKLCDDLINVIKTVNMKKLEYHKGNNVECYISDLEYLFDKNDELLYVFSTQSDDYEKLMDNIKEKKIYSNIMNGIKHREIEEYKQKIDRTFSKLQKIFKSINQAIVFEFNSGYILRKIYGPTREHADGINTIHEPEEVSFLRGKKRGDYRLIRNASIIFALNDDHKGGEFVFTDFDISFKIKKGSVLIFPPYWTHRHRTEALHDDTYRYTLSTWTCEKL